MTWVLVVGLAVAVMAVLVFVAKVPRGCRDAVGAALLLGLAGYAAQASPNLAGSPKAASEQTTSDAAVLVEGRAKITNSGVPTNNRWIVIADGLARNGRFGDAAEVLRGAIGDDPKNADAWLALANALVGHADSTLTPPAFYAYQRAIAAAPKAPGARFFLGLAYAREGRLAEARALWMAVLRDAPPDAPWRLPLAQQLMRLDAAMGSQAGGAAAPEQRAP